MGEIDFAGLQAIKQVAEPVEKHEEPKPWELPDAPPGSTASSLMVWNNQGKPVKVLGPTHYQHLADGRVIPGYNGATHYSEPTPDGGERITRIVAVHEA